MYANMHTWKPQCKIKIFKIGWEITKNINRINNLLYLIKTRSAKRLEKFKILYTKKRALVIKNLINLSD